MQTVLAAREGMLYIQHTEPHWSEPKVTILYWPLSISVFELSQRFGTEEAQRRIGASVTHLGQGVYRDEKGTTYRLINGGQTQSTHTQTQDVLPPKQRGKVLPMQWREGAWYKETRSGWKRA